MPKKRTRKFIDKKNSITFQLVHRSQRDPLIADDDAPQRILMPVEDSQSSKYKKKIEFEKRKAEQEKCGIFFDDDYDYMQHLRNVDKQSVEWERVETANDNKKEKEKSKINLPPTVFESEKQEKVGLLNRAIPMGLQLNLDPDVVAALDDDFDFDNPNNQLEDDFITLAGGVVKEDCDFNRASDENSEEELENNSSDQTDVSSEEDNLASLDCKQFTFKNEETKSRFTEYSMSSSVIRRNKQLTLLDDRFEKMYAEYDDNEIGALECENIDGTLDPNIDALFKDAEKFWKPQNKYESATENMMILMKDRMKTIDQEDASCEEMQNFSNLMVNVQENEKWDCESILSTYSNIYNHPKLISEPRNLGKIKIDSKTGIPKNVLNSTTGKLTAKNLAQFDLTNESEINDKVQKDLHSTVETVKSLVSALSIRPKDETAEERKERKKALKEYRKQRRIERKVNFEIYKEQKKCAEKMLLNNKKSIQGNRLL